MTALTLTAILLCCIVAGDCKYVCDQNVLGTGNVHDVRILGGLERQPEDPIFLGGNQTLFVIDGASPQDYANENFVGVCYDDTTSNLGCFETESNEEQCENYLRKVTLFGNTCSSPPCNNLYVCGTNARSPRCMFCNYTIAGELSCDFEQNVPPLTFEENAGMTSFNDVCLDINPSGANAFQREKQENSTFSYDETTGRIFYGVKESNRDDESFIGTADINTATGLLSGQIRTRADSEKMVAHDASFVGTPFFYSVDAQQHSYFLFWETAQEYESLSSGQDAVLRIYSRIARVCSVDAGTRIGTVDVFTSYLKQRLVCYEETNDVDFYIYYDIIQDFAFDKASQTIYAIFTNSRAESPRSALCLFDLNEIHNTFQTGDFFGADGGVTNDLWRNYDGTTITPRPGFDCNTMNTADTDFQRDYNQMKPDAMNTTVFTLKGDRFSSFEISGTDFIISAESGCMYKIPMDFTGEISENDDLMCNESAVEEPIIQMALAANDNLIVTTEQGVYQLTCTDVPDVGDATPACSISVDSGNYDVRPNSTFELVYKAENTSCVPSITNGTNGADLDSYLFSQDYLNVAKTLVHLKILILDITVIRFNSSFGANIADITVIPSEDYTQDELTQRCDEWDVHYEVHVQLNTSCSNEAIDMAGGSGTFNATILWGYIQSCENCAYAQCVNTCPAN